MRCPSSVEPGPGKATLLNALIGARVLPVSNMRACTAAITEVAFCEGAYRAKVEFISRESWEAEVNQLVEDIRINLRFSKMEGSDESYGISKVAMDKLRTVYAPEKDPADFDPLKIEEPREITKALDAGFIEIESPDLKDFRKQVAQYLDSKHRFWPIVQTVSVQGPFENLKDGAKLIDLPGVNDPNEAREAVTKQHLKTCRFVWIVFNIKRALTKDISNLMQSDDFCRQIVMDGRADALTFVGTASDDIDIDSAIDEFDLDEDAEVVEIIKARNAEVRHVIEDQLGELALRLAQLGQASPEKTKELSTKLKSSRIFTISAREHLRLSGLARTKDATFDVPEDTEVPSLIDNMRDVCGRFGIEAHIQSLNKQMDLLVEEIKSEIAAQRAIIQNQADITNKQREELSAAVKSARDFLKRDLEDSRDRFKQGLDSGVELLGERIKRAVDRARIELQENTIRKWEKTHHGTLGAVCRRGGKYTGSTGLNDFPADMCKPILNGIAFAWSEFFGDRLRQSLDKWADRLRRNSTDYRVRLSENVISTTKLPENITKSIERVFETTEKVLSELVEQVKSEMDNKITEKQRTIYERVPEQVSAHMQEAFETAGQERGPGMKMRMIDVLKQHASEVSELMFDDARDALLGGVRGLNDWLNDEYTKMAESVRNSAGLAADNIVSGNSDLSEDKVKELEKMLGDLESIIDNLDLA